MSVTRKILAGLLALSLAPGTCVRSELPEPDYTSPVEITRLDVRGLKAGPLVLEGAWELASENDHFGGYSALVQWKPGVLLAANDAGRLMKLPRPDGPAGEIALEKFLAFERVDKTRVDLESLTNDPATGRVWAGLEWSQEIIRFDPDLKRERQYRPQAMKDWGSNSGPESLVRLPDGRFIVIEERRRGDGHHNALLFPGDPVAGQLPVPFIFAGREGYRPADAALLPDGRVVVLLRGFELGLPPRFPVMLATFVPSRIGEGKVLRSQFLAQIDEPMPSENYEGVTAIAESDGSWSLWLISDDNFASYQRTLLLKLSWQPDGRRARQKARE